MLVPLGLGAALLVPGVVKESRDERAPRQLDVVGSLLAAAGFALLVFGLVQAEHSGPSLAKVVVPLAVGLALLCAFVAAERRVPAPLVRFRIFRRRQLVGANLAIATNAGSFIGMSFITTLYMQRTLDLSPLEAGLAFVPWALSAAAGGLTAPRLIERLGGRRTASTCLIVTALAFCGLALGVRGGSYTEALLPAFLVAGFTQAGAFVPLAAQAVSARDGDEGLASGLFQTSTHLGGAIVLAVIATSAAASLTAGCLAGATVCLSGAALAGRLLTPTS